MYKGLLGILLVAVASGCGPSFVSMNVQRSALRSTADIGVTVYLDARDITVVDAEKVTLKDVATSIDTFLNTGNVAALPLDQLRTHLHNFVPAQYHSLIDTALLAAVSRKNLDPNAIGVDNLVRIRSALYGMNLALNEYRNEHRKTVELDD